MYLSDHWLTFHKSPVRVLSEVFLHSLIKVFAIHKCPTHFRMHRFLKAWIREPYEPWRQKTYLRTCVPSEDSDQTAHSRSLIRTFTGRSLDYQGCNFSSRGQRRLYTLIRVFVVRTCQKRRSLTLRLRYSIYSKYPKKATTVKCVIQTTCIKHIPVFKSHFSGPLKENKRQFTCIKQASVFSNHFFYFPQGACLTQVWLHLTTTTWLSMLNKHFSRQHSEIFSSFPLKQSLTSHANCLPLETICMKCQAQFLWHYMLNVAGDNSR